MPDIEIKWLNDSYQKFRAKLDEPLGPHFAPWWREVADEAKSVAEREAPVGRVRGGTLQRGHYVQVVNQYRIDIGNRVGYASFVHWGTRAHWMPPGILPYPVMEVIASRDQPANPWLDRALNIMDARMSDKLDDLWQRYLKNWLT